MSKKSEIKSLERREFFKKTGAGLGVAGAVAIGLTSGKAEAKSEPDKGFRKGQYRETEHVKQAYEVARF